MKNYKKLFALTLVLLLALSLLAINAIADFGGFSGGSDYGGGGWDSGGSSDWGGSDWGGSDYGGSDYYYYGGGTGGSGGGDISIFYIAGAVLVFIIIVALLSAKAKKGGKSVAPGAAATPLETLRPISELKTVDPNFSEDDMKQRISNLYVQMQNAWQAKNLESLRPYFTDAQYAQFDRQLQEFRKSGCTNYIENIAVLDVELRGWAEDDTVQKLVAMLNTRIIDYTVNDASGKIVAGDKRTEKFMTYEWTLIRSKGMLTEVQESDNSQGTMARHCPKCGAPLDLNRSAKCPYCDSVISAEDYDWVISQIKGIAQRSG